MYILYNFILFLITIAGGCIPLLGKKTGNKGIQYLLAFSGAFLLSITFLHLLPETIGALHHHAGLLVLAGFFIQLFIQRFTHGVEHGHVHLPAHGEERHIPMNALFIGMSIHAFMEGLPLGFNYTAAATEPSLYLAIAAHKLPEAMLITGIAASIKGRKKALLLLFIFSLVTPAASMLASALGRSYYAMSQAVTWLIPVVAGAFIHIATTIFYESGTRHHLLTPRKIAAILLGIGIGLITLMFE